MEYSKFQKQIRRDFLTATPSEPIRMQPFNDEQTQERRNILLHFHNLHDAFHLTTEERQADQAWLETIPQAVKDKIRASHVPTQIELA